MGKKAKTIINAYSILVGALGIFLIYMSLLTIAGSFSAHSLIIVLALPLLLIGALCVITAYKTIFRISIDAINRMSVITAIISYALSDIFIKYLLRSTEMDTNMKALVFAGCITIAVIVYHAMKKILSKSTYV